MFTAIRLLEVEITDGELENREGGKIDETIEIKILRYHKFLVEFFCIIILYYFIGNIGTG